MDSIDANSVYVINDFSGPLFEELSKAKVTVLGPTALAQIAYRKVLQLSERPVFTLSMAGVGIVLDGYRQKDKEELRKLYFMIHSMGGKIYNGEALTTSNKVRDLGATEVFGSTGFNGIQ